MKRLIIVLSFLFIIAGLSAQKWDYLYGNLPDNLFKPVKSFDGLQTIDRIAKSNSVWFFKLNGNITALEVVYIKSTKTFETKTLSGAGPMISLRHYKPDVNGEAYNDFGIGAGILLGTDINKMDLTSMKAAVNLELIRYLRIGYAYAFNTENHHSILLNGTFDF